MRLCGISSRFRLLSPCIGQVSHALLTRPPLSHKHLPPEGFCRKCFVRLACVKPAASVHPEPGSNSHVECLILSEQSLALFLESVSLLGLSSQVRTFIDENFHLVKDLFFIESFKVVSLFNYQGSYVLLFQATTLIDYHFVVLLSTTFFKKISHTAVSCGCETYNSKRPITCQLIFGVFFVFFSALLDMGFSQRITSKYCYYINIEETHFP